MKKLLALALVGLSLLTGCPSSPTGPDDHLTANPGGQIDLNNASAALISLSTACSGAPISWTYSGTSTPGYTASRDGSVSTAGIFTPPVCGSPLLNTIVTVTGNCTTNGTPHAATVSINIGDEIVNGLSIVAAQITSNTCGISSCWANTPTNITIPACPVGSPVTIQYYALVGTTCASSYYSPSQPPAAASQTPKCPTTVSP